MWLHTTCDLSFDVAVPTPFVLMLRPRSGAQQWVAKEEYRLTPSVSAFEFTDSYGNLCQRLIAPPGAFAVHTAAEVMTADAVDQAPGTPFTQVQDLPDAVLGFLLPSRYCESEGFHQMATEITIGQLPGYDQVHTLVDWLRRTIRYQPGSSVVPVSAVEVNTRGWGVCRDLAHLGIALCRSLSIPARLVVGFLHGLQPLDLHAWFEAFVGNRWYTFDPTQATLGGGYVAIGYGRDAADVAVYSQFGPPLFPIAQTVRVDLLNDR